MRERRSRRRYPLEMALAGRFIGKRAGRISGKTVNLSSQGILIAARDGIPVNAMVELQIEWPVCSGEGEPVRLYVFATVVRSVRNLVAARIWSARLVPGGVRHRNQGELGRDGPEDGRPCGGVTSRSGNSSGAR